MENGWVKLYRKFRDVGYFDKSQYVHLWILLLLLANHQGNKFVWNGKTIIINEGQLLTGRKKLSEETGINESTIEKILNFFEIEHQIKQQKTTKFRIITIINWKEYQQKEQQNNNRITTKEQQNNTNKNDKNDKNENKTVLLLKDWNERQLCPMEKFKPKNIVNKYGAEKIGDLILKYGKQDNGFSKFMNNLKNEYGK